MLACWRALTVWRAARQALRRFSLTVVLSTGREVRLAPEASSSGRTPLHTLADSIMTMPEPAPDNGGWRETVRRQIFKTGTALGLR